MTILIIGSEGFIGNHLVNHFLDKNYQIVGCDLFERPAKSNYEYIKTSRLTPEWRDIFLNNNFNFCINASGSGNVSFSVTHPQSDFESNTLDVVRILDALRQNNTHCKYLHISSAAVYGNPKHLPILEKESLDPISPYGFHKLLSEIVCKEYYELYKIPITIIRPFSVYGPGLKKQLFWDILSKLDESDNQIITLFGTGEESRDFIYISDLMELIYQIIEKDNFELNIYNAATGNETTIREISNAIQDFIPNTMISFSGKTRSGDPNNWRADIQQIKNIGFSPITSINNGIKAYINWFTQNKDD
jgi:dTDP-glucose 4,6-dehydratase/UDP-glucose 4-epimerase